MRRVFLLCLFYPCGCFETPKGINRDEVCKELSVFTGEADLLMAPCGSVSDVACDYTDGAIFTTKERVKEYFDAVARDGVSCSSDSATGASAVCYESADTGAVVDLPMITADCDAEVPL